MRPETRPDHTPHSNQPQPKDEASVPTAGSAALGNGLEVDNALTPTGLPPVAFVIIPGKAPAESVGAVKRGELGYFPAEASRTQHIKSEEEALAFVAMLNERAGVSPGQAQGMLLGSMFGWNIPAAVIGSAPVPPAPAQAAPPAPSYQPRHLQEWDRQHPELAAKLPVGAFVALPEIRDGAYAAVTRGEKGYHQLMSPGSGAFIMKHGVEAWVRHLNDQRGVTPHQAHCLLMGSMFGWDCPGADPDTYTTTEIEGFNGRG